MKNKHSRIYSEWINVNMVLLKVPLRMLRDTTSVPIYKKQIPNSSRPKKVVNLVNFN